MEVQRGLGVTDLLGWFEPAAEDWQASRDLLEMIDYRVDNLLEPTVLTGEYHLILCRNVLLYFPIELRRKVFGNLSRHCAKDGHLILGAGETVIGQTDDFVASRIFKGSYDRRSEEHTSELQSLMRISYAVFCLKKKTTKMQN